MLNNLPAEFGVARRGKVLVVQDEKGQILSITRVSPDSPYGVGVKPAPGQVVKEFDAENLQDALEPEGGDAVKKPRPARKGRV